MNPWLVRHCLLPLHERIMGRPTWAMYRQLQQSQWWPAQRVHQQQVEKLRLRVASALNDTPAYAELAGLSQTWRPESLDDLRRLPLMDKATLSAKREQLVNHRVPGGPIRYNTGGSTGEPLIFYLDKRRQACDRAARALTHEWWGILPGEREAWLWGSPIELNGQDRLKIVRDWLTNDRLIPAFDLADKPVSHLVAQLRRFRPKCLFGYPSCIDLLCRTAQAEGTRLSDLPIKAVFCTAEVLHDTQRQTISNTFGGIPVVNGYGSREGGFISHECPAGNMHILSENVIVELLRDGQSVGPGEDGEIVITHLDNYALPFIRYRTGDLAQLAQGTCACGRTAGLMQAVKGRDCDFIVTPRGKLHSLALIYLVRDIPQLRQYQIVQETVDRLRIRMVRDAALTPEQQDHIRRRVCILMHGPTHVVFEIVPHIPTLSSGKFRYVVSELSGRQSNA